MRVDIYESGQVLTVSNAADTYTIKADEVMINGVLYKKQNLRSRNAIALNKDAPATTPDIMKVNIYYINRKTGAINGQVVLQAEWDDFFWNGGGNDVDLTATLARIQAALT